MRSCSAFEHIISGLVVLLPSNLLTIESTNHKTSKSTFIYDILIKWFQNQWQKFKFHKNTYGRLIFFRLEFQLTELRIEPMYPLN